MRGQGLFAFLVALGGLLALAFVLVFAVRAFPGAPGASPTPEATPSPTALVLATPTPTVTPPPIVGTPFVTPTPQVYCSPDEEGTCVGTGIACQRGIRTRDCVKCGCPAGSECKIANPLFGGYECVQKLTTCNAFNYTDVTWAGVRTRAWECEYCQFSADCCRVFPGASVSGENVCLYNGVNHSCTTARCYNQTNT